MARKKRQQQQKKKNSTCSEQMSSAVIRSEGVFHSRRGVELFTCSWVPCSSSNPSLVAPNPASVSPSNPVPASAAAVAPADSFGSSTSAKHGPAAASCKAVVFLCHGYGMECSIFMSKAGEKLAGAGYAVFGLDYEGHGKSGGKRCYIRRFEDIVDDCHDFFHSVRSRPEFRGKPAFLYGESMGGAVALLLERRNPGAFWNGAVLLAPMCKISENMLPTPWLRWLLIKLSHLIPTWKIVPIKDVIDQSFKDVRKREAIRSNPYIYTDKMILKTAVELLLTSLSLEKLLNQVKMPFIVLHGEDDLVTDPAISKELFNAASSSDKTIKIYSGMWHGLTAGEPDHNVDLVFRDIVGWLDCRSCTSSLLLNPISDGLKKLQEDPLLRKNFDAAADQ